MELFLKRSRGSITVLVTLILVPTIFFTGFLVDLSRLKLCSNQAVMTADNYGEAVLTLYDNLLKELYGLFAVTQDEEALGQLETLENYMVSSMNPSESTISWEHLPGLCEVSYEGFMPYQSADVSLEHSFVEEANLRNEAVFSTQIGDFMKFRIIQQVGDEMGLFDALEGVRNREGDAKVVEKKLELSDAARALYEAAEEYYIVLKRFAAYPDYIRNINDAYEECEKEFGQTIESEEYKNYWEYIDKKEEILEAIEKSKEGTEAGEPVPGATPAPTPEPLSEEERRLVELYDGYDEEAAKGRLETAFAQAVSRITGAAEQGTITFDTFDDRLGELDSCAQNVSAKGRRLQEIREDLRRQVEEGDVTEELRDGIQEELNEIDELFGQLEDYTGIVEHIRQYRGVNGQYKSQVEGGVGRWQEIAEECMEAEKTSLSDRPPALDVSRWKDFRDEKTAYKELYEGLEKCFGQKGDVEAQAQDKENQADDLSKKAAELLNEEDEELSPRNIPDSFDMGTSDRGGRTLISFGYEEGGESGAHKMAESNVQNFSMSRLDSEVNKLLLKLYTAAYDFGMFSSRITNVSLDSETDKEPEESLTGYEKAAGLNYLYQAEIEYILGGSRNSKKNLDAARNKILAFREVVNFTATYSVKEVHNAIEGITRPIMAANPILGLVVNGALRIAVASIETAMDWKKLKNGEAVVLIKMNWADLNAADLVSGLVEPDFSEAGEAKDKIEMDYEQNLMVMLVFLTSSNQVTERTADLIELNVNAAKQGIGSEGTLSGPEFRMKDAYTAVEAVCTLQLDFVVMPKGFARAVAGDAYGSLERFEKNRYQFTVTRGY